MVYTTTLQHQLIQFLSTACSA